MPAAGLSIAASLSAGVMGIGRDRDSLNSDPCESCVVQYMFEAGPAGLCVQAGGRGGKLSGKNVPHTCLSPPSAAHRLEPSFRRSGAFTPGVFAPAHNAVRKAESVDGAPLPRPLHSLQPSPPLFGLRAVGAGCESVSARNRRRPPPVGDGEAVSSIWHLSQPLRDAMGNGAAASATVPTAYPSPTASSGAFTG